MLFPEGTHWYYKNNKQSLPQAKVAIVVLVWREDDEADKVPTIMIAKMNFSQRIFDQKRPVFLQYTQCSDYRETMRTWLGGRGLCWCRRSVGGRRHGDGVVPRCTLRRILRISSWY